jgi:hypothetical protein
VQPDSDLKVIIFVAVFSAIISTPIALVADWLIMNILSAPTLKVKSRKASKIAASPAIDNSQGGESKFDGVVAGGNIVGRQRRRNHVDVLALTNNISLEITKRADENAQNLQKDIKAYREQLLDPQLKKEYDGKFKFLLLKVNLIC